MRDSKICIKKEESVMSTVKNDVECPVYETPSFTLRPTGEGKEICFWQREYEEHKYVRFAVIPKIGGEAAGTLVISGGKEGILRWEFSPDYDREACMEELIRLAVLYFIRDFQMESLKVKVSDTPENIPLLRKYGFVPSETLQSGEEYYERHVVRKFDADKGIAFCGLACCVCGENRTCAGCRKGGCGDRKTCRNYQCCRAKGLEGCWACGDFPCDAPMLAKPRIRAFAEYVAENGEERLLAALKKNEECGVLYHYDGQLTGDYDLFHRKEEIIAFLEREL